MSRKTPKEYDHYFVEIDNKKIESSVFEIKRQIDALDIRIGKLSSNKTINGQPVMEYLLQFADNPEELIPFSDALARAAKLLKQKRLLEKRVTAMETINENPQWFMGELNDFENDVEHFLTNLETDPTE